MIGKKALAIADSSKPNVVTHHKVKTIANCVLQHFSSLANCSPSEKSRNSQVDSQWRPTRGKRQGSFSHVRGERGKSKIDRQGDEEREK